jgi:hypothetical protein
LSNTAYGTIATRPQAVPVNLDGIPAQLKQVDRWVVWRYVEDTDPDTGEVSWDKPPVCACNGRPASSTNSRSWTTYDLAVGAYEQGGLDGLGFVLSPSGGSDERLVGVDLDKCRDQQTKVIEPWAEKIVQTLNSYTEVSPSGKGLRIFVLGRLPAKGRKKGRYENYESGRYVTVTGQHLDGTPATIEQRQAELETVHKRIFGDVTRPRQAGPRTAKAPTDLDDAQLIERAGRAKNGAKFRALWNGDTTGYGSQSEADLALADKLAFWCGPGSAERIDGLIRQSGLYRPKWDRQDYRDRTIAKALQEPREFYDWSRARAVAAGGKARSRPTPAPQGGAAKGGGDHEDDEAAPDGRGDAWEPGCDDPQPEPPEGFAWTAMPLATLTRSARRPEMLAKRVLVRNQPMIVGAPHKTLKTSVMCDLAVSLATGKPFLGHFDVYKPVTVAMFSGESGDWTLAKTFERVCRARGVDPSEAGARLVVQPEGLPQLSNVAHMAYLSRMLALKGVQVFILDPLYLTLLAGVQGDPRLASNLYAMGPLFQNVTGACLNAGATPILVHHTQRAAARSREPLGLEDLAYSGVAEFSRQWILMSRRVDYDGSRPGSHKLWMNAGGSAGHGGLWAVDIEEGEADDDLDGRQWDVTVSTPTAARQSLKDEKVAEKRRKKVEQQAKDDIGVLAAVDRASAQGNCHDAHGRPAAGRTKVRELSGLNSSRVAQAVERLRAVNVIRLVPVKMKVGNGAERQGHGLQRVQDEE